MATDAQTIVDAIDTAIYNKVNGVAWDNLTDRTLGRLGITQSTTMDALVRLRDYYKRMAGTQSGGAEEIYTEL